MLTFFYQRCILLIQTCLIFYPFTTLLHIYYTPLQTVVLTVLYRHPLLQSFPILILTIKHKNDVSKDINMMHFKLYIDLL